MTNKMQLWRMILFSVLLGIVLAVILEGAQERNAALRAVTASNQRGLSSQQAASRRIDMLQGTIAGLTEQVRIAAENRASEDASIQALTEQVKQLGGRPVVTHTGEASNTRPTTATTLPPTPPTTVAPVVPPTTNTTSPVVKRQAVTTTTDPDPVHRTTTTRG